MHLLWPSRPESLTEIYTELTNWLVNAFNGEWLKIANAQPNGMKRRALPTA